MDPTRRECRCFTFLDIGIGDSGGLFGVGTNARGGDSVPEESASVAPNCGAEIDFGRDGVKVVLR